MESPKTDASILQKYPIRQFDTALLPNALCWSLIIRNSSHSVRTHNSTGADQAVNLILTVSITMTRLVT